MANNGIYYSSGNSLNFTTNSTTWATLGSGGTFVIDTVSGGTYLNLPVSGITAGTGIGVSNSNGNYTISYTGSTGTSGDYLPLSGGTVTGGTIFTSGVTANTLSSIDYIDFDLLSGGTAASSVSRLRYVADEGGLVTTLLGGNVDLQIGQQNVVFCYNGDTVNLTKGQVVAIFGNQGNRPKIQRAIASAETTSSTALGVVSETINIGNEGFVTTFGNVRGFNLTGITPGSYLYLSPTVLGGVTGTQPQAPDHIVAIGYVVRTGTTQGEVFVNINNGWELNELHNVRITNPSQYDILQYSAGTYPVWYNTSSPFFSGLTATTISATTYQNLPYSGTVIGSGSANYITKWTASDSIGDSTIYDDGSFVGVGYTSPNVPNSRFGASSIESGYFQFVGLNNGSIAITNNDLTTYWGSGGYEVAIGSGVLYASIGTNNIGIGQDSLAYNTSGSYNISIGQSALYYNDTASNNIAIGNATLSNNNGDNQIAIGKRSLYTHTDSGGKYNISIGEESLYFNSTGGDNVAIGFRAGFTTNKNYNLFVGHRAGQGQSGFESNEQNTIIGNLAGYNIKDSNRNVFIGYEAGYNETGSDRLYISNSQTNTLIYGEFDNNFVQINGNLTVTGTTTSTLISATTYQNLPSFNSVQINGITQFSGNTNSYLNFSGVNITITSAATNTLVFSAGTGGGSGTVTSVALSAGTSGTDVNISNSAVTTSGVITINIPDARYDSRGLVSTSNQKFSGDKDFISGITLSSLNTNQILATNSGSTVQSLSTTTYPSLTELSYVKGVTSAIQTQINSKGSGTVTSVALSAGTSGTDVNISNSAVTTSGTITINIPDASTTARGLITTGTQTIAGNKTINGNLTVTGTTTSATISATTYQNLPTDIQTTGATYSNNTFTFTNNTGGTYSVLFNTVTGLTVNGNLTVTGNTTISGLTANQIVATDANKTLVSLSTTTYPSLTELSYVKGVTSAIQTQFANKLNTFTLRWSSNQVAPADNSTYYFNDSTVPLSTSATIYRSIIPYACTLVGATITAQNNSATATNETSTVSFRLNNLTDTTLSSSVVFNGTPLVVNVYSITGLSVSIAAGDTANIKWVTPTWATNPAAAIVAVTLYLQI